MSRANALLKKRFGRRGGSKAGPLLGDLDGDLWRLSVEHLMDGYALHEAIFGADGRMVDYRFLEYNPAAQRIANIQRQDIVGRTALELYPHILERGLMARYAEVMATGQPAIIEDFYYAGDSLDKAFDISCFRIDHNHFVCIFRDVTDRTRAQSHLRDSDERLKRISRAGNIGLWEWNLATNEVFYSAEWKSQIGYEEHEITNNFSEWSSRVHPDDLAGAQKRVEDFLKEPWDQFENEFRFRHKDGSYRWILATASVQRDRDGRFLAMLGAHIDITARKQAEEALRESEERFRALTASSPTGIYLTDALGRCVYANRKWLDMAGLSLDEALGEGWALGLHPEDRAQVFANWNRTAQAAGKWGSSYRFMDRAGTVTWVFGTAAPIVDARGKTTGYVGVNADITELKRAEEEARRIEDRHRAILSTAMDGFWLVDTQGRLLEVNQTYCKMSGYTQEELLAKKISDLEASESSSDTAAHIDIVAQHGEDRFETCHRAKDGSLIDVEISVQHRPGGHMVAFIRDITARRRAEEERLRLQAQLQQAMKMEAVGRLAGGVAHDFNNLLTGIKGNVALMLMDLKTSDPLVELLSEVAQAADSAASLTRQLLAFSRKQTIEPRVLNLNEIITSAQKMLGRLIGEDIEFETILSGALGSAKVDPGQFEQILVNLAVNAKDAMPAGGKLTVRTDNAEFNEAYLIPHPYASKGSYVLLEVSDTGHGMTEEVKSHLFEPFFTTKPKGHGTGLGLATIYGAVKQADGFLEVVSAVGQGTTFKVYLPRVDEKAQALDAGARGEDMQGGNETILLVEDEGMVRDLVARILKRLGYKVLQAPDGGRAFLLAEEYRDPIDLLLTDVVLPGMDGRQLAERLVKLHPEMKVLYSSGYTQDALGRHGIIEEGLNFLGKPYPPQALAKKLREVLDGPAPTRR